MSQSHWRDDLDTVTRPDDGERIGYLRRIDESRWEALNLLGMRLGDPVTREAAWQRVMNDAMASISRPWWCRVSRPLAERSVDARSVGQDEEWHRMVVVELTSDRALMRPMYAFPEESGKFLVVDLPAADVVREHEPADHEYVQDIR